MEIWRDVVNYEGIYEVSNYGRVRTKQGKQTHSVRHGMRTWNTRILKEKNPKGRDVRVDLWKNKKPKSFLVHRLVAFAFIPEVDGKTCVNHIDGNPRNNHLDNLEWCNHQENNEHAFVNGLMKTNMPVKLINEIGIEYGFISLSRASKFLNRNEKYISSLINRNIEIATDKEGHKYKIIKTR